jgi:glycosyltransferase involved in cell wall biosynthesis
LDQVEQAMNNGSLRVAWDNSLAKRNPTGTGVYATQLIRELAANPGVTLEVFEGWDPARRKPGEFGSQGILARGARAASGLVWSHGYFPYLLRKGKFDVLHSPAFVIPLGCPCPTVATIYDVSFLIFPEHFEWRWRNYLQHVMPSVLRSVSAVICISENAKQDLLHYYKISPEKVHVVYCGIDHTRFGQDAVLDKDWAGSKGVRKDYVLHVGTLSQRKNIPMLLRAVASLRAKGKFENLQLVLAGPELPVLSGGPEIHQAIRELSLSDIVVLAGYVPDDCMPGLYRHAKLLVMPSVYEGFGLPVLESMASGVPVVASNSSSFPEIAGDAAILVSPQDEAGWAEAIAHVLTNPPVAEEMRQKGRARAREFSWQRAAAETVAVYRTVAGS